MIQKTRKPPPARSWATDWLNPRDAVTMRAPDPFALAGTPVTNPNLEYELIYVPRIPVDAVEASAMLAMIIKLGHHQIFAGYTIEELTDGRESSSDNRFRVMTDLETV